ncbi:hypothetical protein SPAN111604_11975 [Sphingomonas antarctica]|uniref:hypothetical protein n=1 Tax=Sphingomonas antarctica TaxID=2040274 RepID=UPI0039E987CD
MSGYAYSSVTVTGPNSYNQVYTIYPASSAGLGNPNLVTAVTDSIGRTTSYQYDGNFRLTRVTAPEGNYTGITYDNYGNVTQKLNQPKAGSGLSATTESSAINASDCATTRVLCFRPVSHTDVLGRTTDYTYDIAGRMTSELAPADANGVRRATYLAYNGGSLTAPGEVRVCAYGVTCGTSAEFKTTYSYFGYTALPLTETRYDGVAGTSLMTTYTYDAAGRRLSEDGPRPGTGDARYWRYDVLGRKTWEIGPANANGTRPATRYTYRNSDDKMTLAETGVLPNEMSSTFNTPPDVVQTVTAYDARRNPIQAITTGGSVQKAQSASFDDRGRQTCSTVRMNPAVFGSLPADACALGTQGTQGADRITKNTYDAADQLTLVQKAYGTPLQQNYVTYTYTNNGKQASVRDANRSPLSRPRHRCIIAPMRSAIASAPENRVRGFIAPRPRRVGRSAPQPTVAPRKNRPRYDGAWRGAPMPQKEKEESTLDKTKRCASAQLGLDDLAAAGAGSRASIFLKHAESSGVRRPEHQLRAEVRVQYSDKLGCPSKFRRLSAIR